MSYLFRKSEGTVPTYLAKLDMRQNTSNVHQLIIFCLQNCSHNSFNFLFAVKRRQKLVQMTVSLSISFFLSRCFFFSLSLTLCLSLSSTIYLSIYLSLFLFLYALPISLHLCVSLSFPLSLSHSSFCSKYSASSSYDGEFWHIPRLSRGIFVKLENLFCLE